VIGFERDMPRRMAAAHVIVGKPGGLTVSEALAAGRPMVLVGACPGQEAMNQAWLIEQGAAIAAAPALAGRTIGALRDQGALASLAEAARARAAPRAAPRVLDVALRLADEARLARGRDRVSAAA
jgi:processive 1,2-diacylglycerol beta-glucosyltransferase